MSFFQPGSSGQAAVDDAYRYCDENGYLELTPSILLRSVLMLADIVDVVLPAADCAFVVKMLEEIIPREPNMSAGNAGEFEVQWLTVHAADLAGMEGYSWVKPYHLLLSCFGCETPARLWLKNRGWVYENTVSRLRKMGIVNKGMPTAERLARSGIELPLYERKLSSASRENRQLANNFGYGAGKSYFLRDYALSAVLGDAATFFNPGSEWAGYILARSRRKLLHWELAVLAYQRCYTIRPRRNYLWGQAYCLMEGGDTRTARELYNELMFDSDNDPDLLNTIGFLNSKEGKFNDAVILFDRCLALTPDDAFAHNNKGFALHRLGYVAEALRNIHHSLTLDRGNAYAWRNLAIIAHESGDKPKAKEYADKAFLYHYRRDFGNDLDAALAG